MAGKLTFTLEDYQQAATVYGKELKHLPILGIKEYLQFFNQRPNVRYREAVTYSHTKAQLAPYKAGRRTNADLNLDFRFLETYFGALNADFEPNTAIQTLLGHKASQALGDAQMTTPSAKEVLALILLDVAETLGAELWKAERDASGETTHDLFDGFDTITTKEIENETISTKNRNYIKLTEKITKANAVDVLKDIMYHMDPILRGQDCFMYCSPKVADWYNEAYKLTSGAVPYNDKYNQVYLEGSNRKITILPLSNKAESNFIHISPKENMLVGYDAATDIDNLKVREFDPDILTASLKMFFGTQIECVDRRRLMVAELAEGDSGLYFPDETETEEEEKPDTDKEGEGEGQNNDNN